MRSARRGRPAVVLGLVLVLALVVGCTAADDEEAAAPAVAEDLGEAEQAAVEAAEAWIAEDAELSDEQRDALVLSGVTSSPAVTNVAFAQVIDDHPVEGAELVVHVLADGEVQGAGNALSVAEPVAVEDPIDAAEAEENAGKAVDGTPDQVGPSELTWVPAADELVLAWAVPVTTVDPSGSWRVLVDAATGDIIEVTGESADRRHQVARAPWSDRRQALPVRPAAARQRGDACDPGPAPSACLFLPDPIYANDGVRPEVGRANEVLEGRPLEGLDDPASGLLVGDHVDTDPGDASVPSPVERDGTWAAGRARPGIEHAMAYYWIDLAHAELERLGFGDVRDEPLPVDAVDTGLVDNALWDGTTVRMGVGSDGINEGEDASGIVHEYGHAVLDEQAPALFDSAEGGAYHEGFADLLAYFVTLEERTGDQACLFPWTEEGQCLRRLDSDLVYPDDLSNQVHADGTIYTGAIWDVFSALLEEEGLAIEDCPGTDDCREVADRVMTTVLTSHGYLLSGTTLPDVAAAYVSANEAAFGGDDEELIEEAFAAHGLTGGGGGSMAPTGELDEPEEGLISVEFEILHSYRGDLDVEVGVLGPEDEELCPPVSLQRPDTTDGEQDLTGLTDVSETECAELAPPSDERRWYLRAVDTLAEDEGEIVGFTVYDGEDPYRAVGLPQPILDADPAGTTVVVDGSGGAPDRPDLPGGDEVEGPAFVVDIDHSYTGDLSVVAGVADGDGDVVCSVEALRPDSGDRGDGGLAGTIELDPCAEAWPPSAERNWFLEVVDHAAVDEGAVQALRLVGPDGETVEFVRLPATVPDDDPRGLLLVADGSSAGPLTSGGMGGGPTLAVEVNHPYAGDLSIEVGAVGPGDEVLCQEQVRTPDPSDDSDGVVLEEVLEDCARAFPPTADRTWYLLVVDTLAQDIGRLVSAGLTGPDGERYVVDRTGVPIPDADPDGILLTFGPEA